MFGFFPISGKECLDILRISKLLNCVRMEPESLPLDRVCRSNGKNSFKQKKNATSSHLLGFLSCWEHINVHSYERYWTCCFFIPEWESPSHEGKSLFICNGSSNPIKIEGKWLTSNLFDVSINKTCEVKHWLWGATEELSETYEKSRSCHHFCCFIAVSTKSHSANWWGKLQHERLKS